MAQRAGTSVAVVSYVMNNGPRPVAARTRERVLAAVAELSYRPNRLAGALRANRSLAIGLLLPDASNPFFAELARVIEDAAYLHGYMLFIGNVSDDPDRETAYVQAFLQRQTDGLLLVSAGGARASIDELVLAGAPVVVVDRRLDGVHAATIVADNEGGGYMATEHLARHGHRRVACLAGPSDLNPSSDRYRGWARAVTEFRLDPDPALLVRSGFDASSGYEATTALLSEQKPTAIFASNDTQAMGALRAAWDAGARVPEDLALVAFDGIAASEYTTPSLTTVVQPIEALGRKAVERLLERIAEPATSPTTETLAVSLMLRRSCGCPDPRRLALHHQTPRAWARDEQKEHSR